MTPAAFRAALATLGYDVQGFARYVGIDPATVWRWLQEDRVPRWAALILELRQRA